METPPSPTPEKYDPESGSPLDLFNSMKIVPRHLIAFVIYMVIGFIFGRIFILAAFLLLAWLPHATILFIQALAKLTGKEKSLAGQYFLAGCMILIIGFGACAVVNSLY
jgi:hypothetical protein